MGTRRLSARSSGTVRFPAPSFPASGNQRRYDFTGVIESLKRKFTFFSPEGVPLRATLSLVLREYKTLDQQIDQLNLNSPNRSHSHVTALGDTLRRRPALLPTPWRVAGHRRCQPDRIAAPEQRPVPPHSPIR
jgi:hypothetical protein